ncbi:DUF2878 domain-containing protein [Erwiniaceae bacterium BAC15a-03b]|uniref:DUF2878 domain-containing protein n=1 Tax=Winslowiella arboricola TaxID=2978220 RepID=A0A9J6PVH7_9GAMM|nr:DUF2878 domain-containing protein [Winslowiella arboricola]MCU5772918.1 DUF2878 domain-containing protein [Winslowiella arboricola]MCU5780654.1 DUF2878 domain-containing protein [Winslowiella arboricola]
MKNWRFWLLTLGFDAYWALAVGLRERGELIAAAIAVLALLLSPNGSRWPLLTLAILGIALDSLWLALDLFHFSGSHWLPLWMLSLWLAFACWWRTLMATLKLPVSGLIALGAIGGPLSYLIGAQLGAMQLQRSAALVYPLLACGWAIYLPLTGWILRNR